MYTCTSANLPRTNQLVLACCTRHVYSLWMTQVPWWGVAWTNNKSWGHTVTKDCLRWLSMLRFCNSLHPSFPSFRSFPFLSSPTYPLLFFFPYCFLPLSFLACLLAFFFLSSFLAPLLPCICLHSMTIYCTYIQYIYFFNCLAPPIWIGPCCV